MRAQVLERPAPVESRPLRLVERPAPVPGPDEVAVRVRACGICRTDLHVVEGELPVRLPGVVPGHQVVGVVAAAGERVRDLAVGDRVGLAWLHRTCGACRFCRSGRENLCTDAAFTGWTVHGGFADLALAPAGFAYRLPEGFPDVQAAPLLCAGIIGYRSLRLTRSCETAGPAEARGASRGDDTSPGGETSRRGDACDAPGSWAGFRLGIYGFGAAGHVVIQLAGARGAEVYVMTRDRERHQALAAELGAAWTGDATDAPPVPLDAAIVFAPAGELIPVALAALDKGGTLVLGGIHMSPIPSFPYERIYGERVVRSVANNTRDDGRCFLAEAARIPVRTHVVEFPLEAANDALVALKNDAIRGAGVLVL